MKNNLKLIEEREILGKEFKIYGDFENPLFLAKDVAEWIEYDKSSINKMLETIDDDEKFLIVSEKSSEGIQANTKYWFLTEDGLYEVLMQSKKPIAKSFKKEVKKILKSIRKNGGYIVNQENLSDKELLAKAFLVSQNIIEEKEKFNKELQEKNKQLLIQNKAMEKKANYFDNLINTNLLLNFRDTAKEFGIGERDMINFLLEKKILFRNKLKQLRPYSTYVKKEYFEIKEIYSVNLDKSFSQTFVTVLGREFLLKLLTKHKKIK